MSSSLALNRIVRRDSLNLDTSGCDFLGYTEYLMLSPLLVRTSPLLVLLFNLWTFRSPHKSNVGPRIESDI